MWKAAFCLLVLIVCMELSDAGRRGKWKKGSKKWKKLTSKDNKHVDNKHVENKPEWKGLKGKNFKKASNPEMMMMMRMKKMLGPLRELFTKVLDLGPQKTIDGQPMFCGNSQCPDFTVTNKTDHCELRHYQPSTWVSTSVIAKSWTSQVQRALFWPLFEYIQGANEGGQKIKMTVPVITLVRPEYSAEGSNYTMSFYLPSSLANIPTPKNDKVTIKYKPSFEAYVHSFKGYAWGQQVWDKHAAMMEKHLDKDGLKGMYYPSSQMYISAGYDDPMKMFNRHNEIWLMAKDY